MFINYLKTINALIALFVFVSVASYPSPDEEDTENPVNIIKGKPTTSILPVGITSSNTFPSVHLCVKDNEISLDAKVLYTHLNKQDIIVVVEATSVQTNTLIETYEVERSNLTPSKEKYKKEILKMNLCHYFDFEKKSIENEIYFFIKFYYEGERWCDVYRSYSFKYQDMDKCEAIFSDYKVLDDHMYSSVEIPSVKDFSEDWTPCADMEPVDICHKSDHFSVRAAAFCFNGLIKYQLTTAYNNLQLGTYKIPNLPMDKVITLDPERVCRLFRFKKESNTSKRSKGTVYAQYFKHGSWRCQKYTRENDKWYTMQTWRKGMQYSPKLYLGICGRFRGYKRPVHSELGND